MLKLKTSLVPEGSLEVYDEELQEFITSSPAKYYIVLATGDYLFFHTREMGKCTQYVKENYDGKYSVRSMSMSKGSGEVTVRGFINSKSRAGSRPVR